MEKPPTLVDVENLAGTSESTAARVFSRNRSTNVKEETKVRVVEAAQRLGYESNRQAASLRSKKRILSVYVSTILQIHLRLHLSEVFRMNWSLGVMT